MATSKKDYIAVAAAIKDTMNDYKGATVERQEGARGAARLIAAELAAYFITTNPHFNNSTFFKACGLEVL